MSGTTRSGRWGNAPAQLWENSFLPGPSRGMERSLLSLDEYKAIFEASPDGCLVVAADGMIRAANPEVEGLFGWDIDELVGKSVDILIPGSLRAGHRANRARFMSKPHNRPMGVGLDLSGERKDGSTFPVEVSLSPWKQSDGAVSVICSVRDVTAHRRLRTFSEGALRASEEERKRIARELHDDTAQRLVTLMLRVRTLAEQNDDAARLQLFEDVRSEIVEAAESVKRMSRGLRPPEIGEVGLVLALHAHVRSLQEAGGFTVETDMDVVDPFLDVTAKLALYRIVQEALSNVRRHARTDRASVRLVREQDDIVAEIRDRGQGFVLAEASDDQRGLGLIGMQERATMIGGRLVIDAIPGEGTCVRVSVPATELERENA